VENNIRRIKLRSMKTKLYKILGVALTLVLLASLTVGLTTIPTGAASSNLKFVKLELPKVEDYGATFTSYGTAIDPDEFANSEGDFWATPAADLGPIAITPDGGLLFAAVADGFYYGSNWFHVLKSSDGGYSWIVTGFYDYVSGTDVPVNDYSPIVDIVTSPEYSDDTTLAVATMAYVYISEDGGKTFTQLGAPWGGPINDLDITVAEDGDLSLIVATSEPEVYVTSGLLAWKAQGILTSYPFAYDVLAAAFLPTFADDGDIGICAIINDAFLPITMMVFTFADISVGGEWGDAIADAPFVNADLDPFVSDWARIAFPDDFDAFGTGNNVCFAGIVQAGDLGATSLSVSPPSGSDAYRVICKEAGSSTAVDLDVRGVLTTLAPTATAITSIDVCGDAEEATILVGTDAINLGDAPEYFSTYISEDSGDSWTASAKCPTGGAPNSEVEFFRVNTGVLMAPDFCSSGLAYASTWGYMTDAFQKTTDANESWNQISLIDFGLDNYTSPATGVVPAYWVTNYGFNAFGYIANDTLWMIIQNIDYDDNGTPLDPSDDNNVPRGNASLFGRLDGSHFERILSYATPGVSDYLNQIQFLGDGSGVFASDSTNGLIWRSTDMGATWPKKISTKDGLMWVQPVSTTTIYTAHVAAAAGGSGIWWTTRSGTGWTKPDDSEIPASAMVWSVSVMGDIVYCGTDAGHVFISSDGGDTVERVGSTGPLTATTPPGFAVTLPTTDLTFDPGSGGFMYATNPAGGPDIGVWRASVDLDDPGDAEWEQIDDNQDATGDIEYDNTNFAAGSPAIALPPSGILYVVDANAVGADSGGLWRSTNPTADTDSVMPPYFERENKGLDTGMSIGLKSLDLNPAKNLAPTLFVNTTSLPYYEQIWMFTDILNVGVTPVTPEADATGVGLLPENWVGDVYPVVTFGWAETAGATMYQLQISIDPEFKTKVWNEYTNTLGTIIDEWLLANSTYYWRVRVADWDDNFLGAPLISPWSQTFKFKTVIGPSMQRPLLQAPLPGEMDVPLSPTFEWSGIEWAETYEFELALSPTTTAGGYFTEPLVALVSADALVSTAWKCDIQLGYDTRYYWHVKALGVDTDTPWSDVGTFTTMGVPAEPPTTQPPVVIPPAENITPAWIWAIVIIGAILVIAVIVLIVTTRRVP
jgi:hypothetical protein